MHEIYINKEAMERARSKQDMDMERYFWRFIWFTIGIAVGYAWFWMQGVE